MLSEGSRARCTTTELGRSRKRAEVRKEKERERRLLEAYREPARPPTTEASEGKRRGSTLLPIKIGDSILIIFFSDLLSKVDNPLFFFFFLNPKKSYKARVEAPVSTLLQPLPASVAASPMPRWPPLPPLLPFLRPPLTSTKLSSGTMSLATIRQPPKTLSLTLLLLPSPSLPLPLSFYLHPLSMLIRARYKMTKGLPNCIASQYNRSGL